MRRYTRRIARRLALVMKGDRMQHLIHLGAVARPYVAVATAAAFCAYTALTGDPWGLAGAAVVGLGLGPSRRQ